MMKKILLLIALFIGVNGNCQENIYNTQELSNLCKVWGIHKYFSPAINVNHEDADSLLLQILKKYDLSSDFNSNEIYSDLLGFNNDSIIQYQTNTNNSDSLYKDLFSNNPLSPVHERKIKGLLSCSYDSLHYMDYLYPQGSSMPRNENAWADSVYPSEELRLLSLFRYWNWVYYFFPYKHLIDEPWDDVLSDGIVSMIEASNVVEYHMNLREIIVRIDDAHSYSDTDEFINKYAISMVPMLFTVINDSLYIRKVLGLEGDVALDIFSRGDQILGIDNKTFDQLKDQYLKYTPGSNKYGKYKKAGAYFKWTQKDSVFVKYIHAGDTVLRKIQSLNFDVVNKIFDNMQPYDSLWHISDDIIYVDPKRWPNASIPTLVEKIYDSKAIILDLRNYPEWTQYNLLRYLPHDTTTPTFRFWEPTPNVPGRFELVNLGCIPQRSDSLYKGKIITLVDIFSQSRCEFYCMAMQIADNNTTVGTTTSGADGDISKIILPGNIETWFSGIGIEYSDGRQCQQTGIHIDHVLDITPEDWRQHEDPYLAKTIEYVNSILK